MRIGLLGLIAVFVVILGSARREAASGFAQALPFPPKLANDKAHVVDTSPDFLKASATLKSDVKVAKAIPTVEFAYFPGQTYPGNPWSCWGESLFANGKYYASAGDHTAPAGTAFVYEFDPKAKTFRQLVDVKKLLALPEGHYSPGKIHTNLSMGKDGWIYFATHRGSTRVTTPANHFTGEWIIRVNPITAVAEIVSHGPVPQHCIPTGFLDPDRLIFYGGTTPGELKAENDGVRFFAYDVAKKKVLCDVPDGPARAMIFAKSTGIVYYVPAKTGGLMKYDPAKGGNPVKIPGELGLRAASDETKDGIVYTVANGQGGKEPILYAFDTKTESIKELGAVAVGTNNYITALKLDPTGRYLYYIPGAHGGADKDGSPVVQYDTKTNARKVIAFLHPFYKDKYGVSVVGTYSYALSPDGADLYVTWNANRGGKVWDVCALTVIHIPESERVAATR